MDRQKVITDWLLTTQDTIYTLQTWQGLLENWRKVGRAEPDDFMDACRQLKEANLWQWASRAGGHGIQALAGAVQVSETFPDEIYPR
jgi:hypothetical protein